MKHIALILAAVLMTAACTTVPVPAMAQAKINVMVMGDDADLDSVSRNNRVFNRVLAELQNQMNFGGYDTFDERAVTGANFRQDRVRRTDSEVIQIAKLQTRPPVDVVILFSIFPRAEQTRSTTLISARVTGKILHIPDGRVLGNFEVKSPSDWTAPFDCNRDCLLEAVGDKAQILARSMGDVLVAMLDDQAKVGKPAAGGGPPAVIASTVTLTFENFTDEDRLLIEEYMVAFSGYQTHRAIYVTARYAEYSYKTKADSAELVRKLTTMLDRMGISGRVTGGSTGEYQVTKIQSQERRRINTDGL